MITTFRDFADLGYVHNSNSGMKGDTIFLDKPLKAHTFNTGV